MTGKPKTSLATVVPVGFCAATVTVCVDSRTEVLVTVRMRSSNLKAGLCSPVTLSCLFGEAVTHLSTKLVNLHDTCHLLASSPSLSLSTLRRSTS